MLETTHIRENILTGEKILVSYGRLSRPWQGNISTRNTIELPEYVADCYLCPGNNRANGNRNPNYKGIYVFDNDFPALTANNDTKETKIFLNGLLTEKQERGICRVMCYSEKHNRHLSDLSIQKIADVVRAWQNEYEDLCSKDFINYVQIFENRGEMMGCSNPHPHCQIWAQESIPYIPYLETQRQEEYYFKTGEHLLLDYLQIELDVQQRLVVENENFVVLVPHWATWPFETLILPRRPIQRITDFNENEIYDFAQILKVLVKKYDTIFNTPFPYSAGIHQAPCDSKNYDGWILHMHFYPPLLRSAEIRKFMVGYEMLANPQRDITPEKAAEIIRNIKL